MVLSVLFSTPSCVRAGASPSLSPVPYLHSNNVQRALVAAFPRTISAKPYHVEPHLPRAPTPPLVEPVESGTVFGLGPWIILRQSRRCVRVHCLFFLRWRRTFRGVNLGAAEISIIGTLQIHVVQDALVVHALRFAAAAIHWNKFF